MSSGSAPEIPEDLIPHAILMDAMATAARFFKENQFPGFVTVHPPNPITAHHPLDTPGFPKDARERLAKDVEKDVTADGVPICLWFGFVHDSRVQVFKVPYDRCKHVLEECGKD
jgi:hypothetical protein